LTPALRGGSRTGPAESDLDFADALRRRLEPARRSRLHCAPLATSPTCASQPSVARKAPASTRRYFFFAFRRFAVLRAVFFAADFVFDFAFFAILPS